jgi:hypothetical protein
MHWRSDGSKGTILPCLSQASLEDTGIQRCNLSLAKQWGWSEDGMGVRLVL